MPLFKAWSEDKLNKIFVVAENFAELVSTVVSNQDCEFNLIRFSFSELNCGIAWSLKCFNLEKPFKNKIHQFLLTVLGNEDDYVDVSTLMLKIPNYH